MLNNNKEFILFVFLLMLLIFVGIVIAYQDIKIDNLQEMNNKLNNDLEMLQNNYDLLLDILKENTEEVRQWGVLSANIS